MVGKDEAAGITAADLGEAGPVGGEVGGEPGDVPGGGVGGVVGGVDRTVG